MPHSIWSGRLRMRTRLNRTLMISTPAPQRPMSTRESIRRGLAKLTRRHLQAMKIQTKQYRSDCCMTEDFESMTFEDFDNASPIKVYRITLALRNL